MNIDSLMRAVGVRRWHTEPQIGSETDGHHCAVVALLADDLAELEDLDVAERYYLIREALRHDLGEYWCGDIPAPAKKHLHPDLLAELATAEENARFTKLGFGQTPLIARQAAILKLSDSLAAAVHAAKEAMLGNRDGARVLKLLVEYVRPQLSDSPLRTGTLLRGIDTLRQCAMIADCDSALITINTMEGTVCQK